jgi:hypothetical protein
MLYLAIYIILSKERLGLALESVAVLVAFVAPVPELARRCSHMRLCKVQENPCDRLGDEQGIKRPSSASEAE